ncbi:MAG: hypothetical protein KF803_02775 [Cyclobacteriaceae bacterium]|nr:hypothetical protein [Cyclobacteriaceae bacterium]
MQRDMEFFNSLDDHGRAVMVWELGEYVLTRDYYGYRVNLYAMPGYYVEIYYRPGENRMEKIEGFTDRERLEKFLPAIQLDDSFES